MRIQFPLGKSERDGAALAHAERENATAGRGATYPVRRLGHIFPRLPDSAAVEIASVARV